MIESTFKRHDWQALIDAHPLESHDSNEWLKYGIALLQTIQPGPSMGKQQQQVELAFIRAKMEGATAEEITAARIQSVMLSLREAISLSEIIVSSQIWERMETNQ